ncbi:MAG TPA: PilN domain-containing protein, partial [Chloroflexota bacterium]|nr:PilN domain-containing protein [Chloroflexota bacterium]
MFLGASSPANRPRPRLVDLNLVPAEYRRKPFPIVTVGLSLFTLGALLLLYALYYARSYSNLEIAQLSARVAQGQAIVQTATGDPAALARQDKLRAMRDDYQVLAQRQINWGDVFQTIADVPSGVLVRSASQAGFGVTINGSAINQEAAANYLQQLKNSGLFVNASIQVQPAREPLAFITPTPPPTPVRSESTPPSGPTSAPAIAAAQPSVRPSETARPSQPTATFTESPRLTATATAPPTITLTPTRTGTPQPTSTPAYDFALISVVQVAAANPNAPNSDIKGQVLDAKGKGVAGLTIEIDSEGSPAWSAQTTTAGDGTFSFNVNHGKFQVEVIGGRSQTAKDLYTGADGTPGTWGYQLVFAETFTGPIPTVPPSLYTPTWTPTPDPTATITPVAPGANIASYGCTSAYLVQNGQRVDITGSTNPSQAIDGNMSTEWN